MFASVLVDSGAPVKFITLPQTAIQYNTYGNTVYLAQSKEGKDGKNQLLAVQKVVVTGETRGDQVTVTSGVAEGDEVVTSGQVKLRNNKRRLPSITMCSRPMTPARCRMSSKVEKVHELH